MSRRVSGGSAMGLISCPACSRQVSEAAPACPACGHPFAAVQQAATPAAAAPKSPSTTSSTAKGCLAVILLLFVLVVLGKAVGGGDDAPSVGDPGAIAWVATAKANCVRYEEQVNDIKKSEVFRLHQDFPIGQRFTNARGVLKTLRTDHGGDDVAIEVAVAGVEASAATSPDRGTPLYEQVTSLREGQCVIVNGTVVRIASVLERSVMCDLDYAVDFESIAPCN